MRPFLLLVFLVSLLPSVSSSQSLDPLLLDADVKSGLPVVVANDNRVRAGTLADNVLEVDLVVDWADWRPETLGAPGVKVVAVSENGKRPSIPAPLLRVKSGTMIRARVKNNLSDSTITVFGFYSRPSTAPDSLHILPGETGTVEFEPGVPGTYFYRIQMGQRLVFQFGREQEQLAGAFVVDPVGGSPPDRIFVMNIFSFEVDRLVNAFGSLDVLTINGKSWPFTEKQRPAVGETQRWRIINASRRNHPMHLHGFFYDVLSIGSERSDTIYPLEGRRKVVTEFMPRRSTMSMEWTPSRPGNWLFHCHLSFHVSSDVRLPGAVEATHNESHMAGLVLGIEIPDGPSDLIFEGERRDVVLQANEYSGDSTYTYGFSLDPQLSLSADRPASPGPLLLLNQYQPTFVTVKNKMSIPTGIHWHGLELDSWADGVPEWSSSDGRVSPVIHPGEEFTYKLGLMRPGTFIYHSHLDDVSQLTQGLYGPLIVLANGQEYDPEYDHYYVVGWRDPDPRGVEDWELNGRTEQPTQDAVVGETHRIRALLIAPAGGINVLMLRDNEPIPIRQIAKDGADLPPHQQIEIERSRRMGVGETADFTFTPTNPGEYELFIRVNSRVGWRQKWIVSAAADGD